MLPLRPQIVVKAVVLLLPRPLWLLLQWKPRSRAQLQSNICLMFMEYVGDVGNVPIKSNGNPKTNDGNCLCMAFGATRLTC